MIESLLIANRGEIARRIMRTARALGIRTIAVHSDVDADMPFVREADEAVMIGPAQAGESYLAGARILEAARRRRVRQPFIPAMASCPRTPNSPKQFRRRGSSGWEPASLENCHGCRPRQRMPTLLGPWGPTSPSRLLDELQELHFTSTDPRPPPTPDLHLNSSWSDCPHCLPSRLPGIECAHGTQSTSSRCPPAHTKTKRIGTSTEQALQRLHRGALSLSSIFVLQRVMRRHDPQNSHVGNL